MNRCWIHIDQFHGNSTLIETKRDELNIGRTTLALQTFAKDPRTGPLASQTSKYLKENWIFSTAIWTFQKD